MDPCKTTGLEHEWMTLSKTLMQVFVPEQSLATVVIDQCRQCQAERDRTFKGSAETGILIHTRTSYSNGGCIIVHGADESLSVGELRALRTELEEQLTELGPATKTVEVPVDAYETDLGVRCLSGWECQKGFIKGDALIEDIAAHYTVKGVLWHEPHGETFVTRAKTVRVQPFT